MLDGWEQPVALPGALAANLEIAFERLDDFVGWIRRIEAGGPVDEGDDPEDDDGPEPQPHAPAGGRVQDDGKKGEQGHGEPEDPQVPLGIAPGGRVLIPPHGLQKVDPCKPGVKGSRGIGRSPSRPGSRR